MSTRSYEIRVVGSIGPAAREAFSGMGVDVEPTITVLSGTLDQGSLHQMLDRVRALGLELVEVRQVPPDGDQGGLPGVIHPRQVMMMRRAETTWRH